MTAAADYFTGAYFSQFHTKKYQNSNPFQRKQISKLLGRVVELARPLQPKSIIDAGGGEGFLTGYLAHEFPQAQMTVVDFSAQDLGYLKQRLPRVETVEGNLETFDLGRKVDLLVATEVLEHLRDARAALKRFVTHADRIIVTVPNEPIFMLTNFLRGKNLARLGNDAEHINHWNPASLKRFLSRELEVDTVEAIFPWIVASGHRRA
ncbi:MAG: methyltransferase domain-containing protein [Candidatus Kerfeldbacteria bacterium]|nr:methyltransferase domain-containing protein [Candidatus Kerfeldbacteria bacterium]